MVLEAGLSCSTLVSKNASSSPSVTSNSWLALRAEMTRTSSSSKSRIIDVTGNVYESKQAFKALVNKEPDEEEEADADDDEKDFRISLPNGPRPTPSNALLTSSTKIQVLTKSRFNVSATAALARMPSRRVRPEPQQD